VANLQAYGKDTSHERLKMVNKDITFIRSIGMSQKTAHAQVVSTSSKLHDLKSYVHPWRDR